MPRDGWPPRGPCLAHQAAPCLACRPLCPLRPHLLRARQAPSAAGRAPHAFPALIPALTPAPTAMAAYRERYPNPNFREKYFTNYSSPPPHLGLPSVSLLPQTEGPEPSTGLSYRCLNTSVVGARPASSRVEETVIQLNERADQLLAEQSQVEDLEKKINSVMEEADLVSEPVHITSFATILIFQAVKVSVEKKASEVVVKKSIWEMVKVEAKHYYSGF